MTELHIDPDHASGTLIVDSGLTIAEAAGLKAQLMEAFNTSLKVTVDLSALTSVDVAGVQLLCAAHRYAVARGCELRLFTGGNQALCELAGKVGISCDSVCSNVDDDVCPMSVPAG